MRSNAAPGLARLHGSLHSSRKLKINTFAPQVPRLFTASTPLSNVLSRAPQLFQDDAPKAVKGKAKEAKEAVQAAAPSFSMPSVGFNPSLLALPGTLQ